MILAHVDGRADARTGRGVALFPDAWPEGSGPGIPFGQFRPDFTTPGSSRGNVSSPWERCSFRQHSNRFLAQLLNALPYGGTGSTDVVGNVGVVIAAEPQDYGRLWQMPVQDDALVIARIRSALSLQMKELAEAIGVERPTVYAWLKGHSTPQKPNRDRLHRLYRLAQCWERLCHRPVGDHLREAGPDGTSLMDMLRDQEATQAEITRRFEAVAARVIAEHRAAPPSVRSLARKHNIPLEKVKEQQDEIDLLTGKGFDED